MGAVARSKQVHDIATKYPIAMYPNALQWLG